MSSSLVLIIALIAEQALPSLHGSFSLNLLAADCLINHSYSRGGSTDGENMSDMYHRITGIYLRLK